MPISDFLIKYENSGMGFYYKCIIVKDKVKKMELNITDIVKFLIDYKRNIYNYGYHIMMPNTIIVKEITQNDIEKTIYQLNKYNYFDELGSIRVE